MRPSSKPGLKTSVSPEMFSNTGVIEFRSGVLISPEVETAVDSKPFTPSDAHPCATKHCADQPCSDDEPSCGEGERGACEPEGPADSHAQVKKIVFQAVKTAVIAQNKAEAASTALRKVAAADLQAKTLATEMNVRRLVRDELNDHESSENARGPSLQAQAIKRSNMLSDAAMVNMQASRSTQSTAPIPDYPDYRHTDTDRRRGMADLRSSSRNADTCRSYNDSARDAALRSSYQDTSRAGCARDIATKANTISAFRDADMRSSRAGKPNTFSASRDADMRAAAREISVLNSRRPTYDEPNPRFSAQRDRNSAGVIR